ncbi:hypothetical protein CDAR_248381 [Caerostris darwini]|uniref:Uncharacterized protein n=1 Tax=Caerostris darwini TaxID=1538125 RepID=A0AAV4UXK5_9ARAC|nr:hypothetical protein CDAR_248381 [Caerostris darwini]
MDRDTHKTFTNRPVFEKRKKEEDIVGENLPLRVRGMGVKEGGRPCSLRSTHPEGMTTFPPTFTPSPISFRGVENAASRSQTHSMPCCSEKVHVLSAL